MPGVTGSSPVSSTIFQHVRGGLSDPPPYFVRSFVRRSRGELVRDLAQIRGAHYVLAIEHGARLVPSHRHGHALDDAVVDMLRTAVRRKSCRSRPATPAASPAVAQAFRKSRIRVPRCAPRPSSFFVSREPRFGTRFDGTGASWSILALGSGDLGLVVSVHTACDALWKRERAQ